MKKYSFMQSASQSINTLMKSGIFAVIAVSMLLCTTSLIAQNINEEVTVTAAYEPTIPDANKINIEPPESETEVTIPVMTYSNSPDQMLVSLKPENIAAVRLLGEPVSKLYRNYVRAGMGTYTTPFIDLYASSLRSDSYALGLHLKHISSAGDIEGYPETNNSLNQVELYGQRFFSQHTLSSGLGFRRNVVRHYGFLEEDFNELSSPSYTYSEDGLKQRFARLNGNIGIKSAYREDDKFNHFADVNANYINDLFGTSETEVALNAGGDKRFELFDFTDHQTIGLLTDVIYNRYVDSTLTQNNTLVTLKPFISTSFNEYSIKAGLNINFKMDTVSKAYLFPFVEGQLKIIDDALVVHAGITGNIKRQSFNELSDINPFVQSALPLQYTREKFTFYAGLRARAGSNIDFSALIRSSSVANAYFFVNDYSQIPYNRFTLLHDDGQVLEGRFEAQYHTAERISVKLYAEFESWSLDNFEHPWHTPALKFGLDGHYQIQNKIIVRANVAARGNQYARTINLSDQFVATELDAFVDLSLGVEYRYTKVLSGFINFNNITNSQYFLWNNYPSYKFNLMGGVAYSF